MDILESSCGDGVFLEEIKKGGYEYKSVTGVEYNEIEAEKSKAIGWDKAGIFIPIFMSFALLQERSLISLSVTVLISVINILIDNNKVTLLKFLVEPT